VVAPTEASEPKPKMSAKEFEKEMEKLQVELVKMQEWVKATGAKVCVLFEGRDTAGKGGVIKRITERTSPRVFRVVALSAPTDREKSQMYFWAPPWSAWWSRAMCARQSCWWS
jgi:polyphosphate kinase 2 (PPK2 family)